MHSTDKDILNFKIVNIEPTFNYEKVSGGYFEITFDKVKDSPFRLSFVPFLDYRLNQDKELYDFIKARFSEKTVSHAIWDLYDMGFPVDEWVEDYIKVSAGNIDIVLYHQLLQLYQYVKGFGGEPSGSV